MVAGDGPRYGPAGASDRVNGGCAGCSVGYGCNRQDQESVAMAKKSAVRTLVVLDCTECKAYSYNTEKNRRNTPDRIELKKFCPVCRKAQVFREKR